eukprot:CAMPEP_0115880664 /NCGR_PEP_ID=MMETSP0287-20121206/28000_1 /TAXON_ID=412157 /ORGANISM="Chrysochromulina rotalis, Strain UIO044" /LENGTH=97 /DNA_ID=CAMNT_0003336507 /DNA_START=663 /DNA_END=956 /DNA_ORIENTATION=+
MAFSRTGPDRALCHQAEPLGRHHAERRLIQTYAKFVTIFHQSVVGPDGKDRPKCGRRAAHGGNCVERRCVVCGDELLKAAPEAHKLLPRGPQQGLKV